MSQTTKIAFVDDHPVLLNGIARIFREDDRFEVVAQGGCADDALAIAIKHRPEILVIDLSMPGDVFSTMTNIVAASPRIKIIAFTAVTEIDTAVKTLRAGASGYVLKGSTVEELYEGISYVLQGDTFITRSFAGKVLTALSAPVDQTTTARLSARETQIVKLLLKGQTNRQIACELKISEKTVKHYMSVLMQKLNARNRLEVAMAAQQMPPFMLPGFSLERRSLPRQKCI